MPSEKNLQLLLTVPVLLAALCAAAPAPGPPAGQPETSEVSQQSTSGKLKFHKLQDIADLLLRSITRLRDEQFQTDFGEPVTNMTNYEAVRTEMPLIRIEDRCRPKNFNAPRCLQQIYAGLRIYEEHLGYLEKENRTVAHLADVKQWTSNLVKSISPIVEVTHIQFNSSITLQNESAWKQRTFIHSILYNFSAFLIDANRAIKYMNEKCFNYVKTENKGLKCTSEKHQH